MADRKKFAVSVARAIVTTRNDAHASLYASLLERDATIAHLRESLTRTNEVLDALMLSVREQTIENNSEFARLWKNHRNLEDKLERKRIE